MSSRQGWFVALALVACGGPGGTADSGTDAGPDGGELIDGSMFDGGPADAGLDGGFPDAQPCRRSVFRDVDEDGFGDPAVSMVGACEPPPAGFVENSGDCYDANPDVHPGQAASFEAERGDGSFDYDCDGTERLLWPELGLCPDTTMMPPVPGTAGWRPSAGVPGCGVSGDRKNLDSLCAYPNRVRQQCR